MSWRIRLDCGLAPDITVAVRMNESNAEPRDFYLLPSIDMTIDRLRLGADTGLSLDAFRALRDDAHFVTLLRTEGLDALPNYLAQSLDGGAGR